MNDLLDWLIEKHDEIEEEYENCTNDRLHNGDKDWLEGQLCAYENIIQKVRKLNEKNN